MKYSGAKGGYVAAAFTGLTAMVLTSAVAYGETDLSFEATGGLRYDGNISVPSTDLLADDSDYAALFGLKAELETDIGSDTTFEVGYSYRRTDYFDRSDFDIEGHGFKARLKHDFGAFKTGLTYRYYLTSLGGNDFLHLQKIEPYVSFYASKNLYVRGTYAYTDKNVVGQLDRNAKRHGIGADMYYFMNRKKNYFLVGYRYDDQNAVGDEFDYSAHRFKARYSMRLPIGGHKSKLKFGWLYENRSYDNITPSIGAIRDDDKHTLTASWEVPFGKNLFAELEYRYRDYSSNLASANYTESRATIEVGVKF